MDKKNKIIRYIVKGIINLLYFALVFSMIFIFSSPEEFYSNVRYYDFHIIEYLLLILYRFAVYFSYPFIASLVEHFIIHKRGTGFKYLLIENYNIQFLSYAFISSLEVLFGLDEVIGSDIIGNSSAFIFVGAFVFTLLINRDLPNIFYDERNLYRGHAEYSVLSNIEISTIQTDYDPAEKTRTFLSFEYNDVSTDKELTIILKSPGNSFMNAEVIDYDTKCIDLSTKNIMKYVDIYNKNHPDDAYKKITVYSLFPNCNIDGINKRYKFEINKSVTPDTMEYLKAHKIISKMENENDVLFAWGEAGNICNGSYNIAINDMKEHFKNNRTLEFTDGTFIKNKSLYPLSPDCWNIN